MEGSIKKRITRAGAGKNAELNQDVRCTYKVFAARKDGELFQYREQVRFRIGEGEAVPALELCLRHMLPGEHAEVQAAARFAWGPEGCRAANSGEKEVPPSTDVRFEVELLEVLPLLPPDTEPAWVQRVQELEWRKVAGNDHFKRRKIRQALKCYELGLQVFPEFPIQAPPELGAKGAAAAAAVGQLLADCSSNMAAVHLELDEVSKARDAARMAVELCPEHSKAMYRLAKAALLLGDFTECEAMLKRLQEGPQDSAVTKLQAELRAARQKYSASSKRLGAQLLKAAERPEEPGKGKEEEQVFQILGSELIGSLYLNLESWAGGRTVLVAMLVLIVLAFSLILLVPSHQKHNAIIFSCLTGPVLIACLSIYLGAAEKKDS